MKKTIIAAMLAIATFVSFSAQAQTADGNTVKTEQCQKKECKKDKRECKKDKKCKKGAKDFKGKKGGKKGGKHFAERCERSCNKMLFKGVNLTEEQRAKLKEARIEMKEQEKVMMDAKVKDILTPEQYTVYQQNQQKMDSVKAARDQRKAEMKAKRAEFKAKKAEKKN